MEKILISGTGRSGTTFLIKLFSFLEFDTGFTKNNYQEFIDSKCNSGMEKRYNDKEYILKNPTFIDKIEKIVNDNQVKIKYMIIPIRDYNESAKSREKYSNGWGGLWNATNKEEQINFYYKIMAEYLLYMTKYEINTIFINFSKMVNDSLYLYNKLKLILNENKITYTHFSYIYEKVSKTTKPNNICNIDIIKLNKVSYI